VPNDRDSKVGKDSFTSSNPSKPPNQRRAPLWIRSEWIRSEIKRFLHVAPAMRSQEAEDRE
jgi:hypothetical protein